MRIVMAALLLAGLSTPVLAQSTPPPLPGTSSGGSSLESLGRAIFSTVEKAAIEEFFGRSATPAERILIDAAKDAVMGAGPTATTDTAGSSSTATQYNNAADDDDDKSWKKNKHKGKGKGRGKSKGKGKNKGMPPGLAKKKQLPPGLQKRLAKHGSLPPGLAKRDLPADLQHQLPPPQPGTERVIAGSDVVLVDQATNAVLDILYDVVTGTAK